MASKVFCIVTAARTSASAASSRPRLVPHETSASPFGRIRRGEPPSEQTALKAVLARYADSGAQFHALRTRQAGPRRFVSMHVLVPGDWTVHRGHELLERIEADVRHALPETNVFTHLEALDDPASWDDESLDREAAPARKS